MLTLLMPIITLVGSLFRSTAKATGNVIKNRSNELLICLTVVAVGYGIYHLGSKMSTLINKTDAALNAVQQQTARIDQQQELLSEMISLQKDVIDFNKQLSEEYYASKEQRDKSTTDVVTSIHNGDLRLRLNRPIRAGESNSSPKASLQGASTANQSSIGIPTFRVTVPTEGTFNPSSLGLSTVVN